MGGAADGHDAPHAVAGVRGATREVRGAAKMTTRRSHLRDRERAHTGPSAGPSASGSTVAVPAGGVASTTAAVSGASSGTRWLSPGMLGSPAMGPASHHHHHRTPSGGSTGTANDARDPPPHMDDVRGRTTSSAPPSHLPQHGTRASD